MVEVTRALENLGKLTERDLDISLVSLSFKHRPYHYYITTTITFHFRG